MPLKAPTRRARSGEVRAGDRLAESWGGPVVFVATAEARDADMAERIEQHRRDRPARWTTVEEPRRARRGSSALLPADAFVLLDCLSPGREHPGERVGRGPDSRGSAGRGDASLGRPSPSVVVNEVGLASCRPRSSAERTGTCSSRERNSRRGGGLAQLVVAGRARPGLAPHEHVGSRSWPSRGGRPAAG